MRVKGNRGPSAARRLLAILHEARELLARPGNDSAWSSWSDGDAALCEIDALISRLEVGDLPERSDLEVLFLPTGPIQEMSVTSGWGQEFLELADRFDRASRAVYGRHPREIEAHKAALARFREEIFGGSGRWLWTVLFMLSSGFMAYLWYAEEPAEVYFPIHLKGPAVWWVAASATVVYAVLAIVNWRSWSKRRRGDIT